MKSRKPVDSSQQFLKDISLKKATALSYASIIKIPATIPSSIISEQLKKKLFDITDDAGSSIVENRMPLKLLLNHPDDGVNKNILLFLSAFYKKEIYRVDVSQVTSKYIAETEKNLERLFQKADEKDWILFLDEADALFGKRTHVHDAHDKYANQEIARTGRDLSLLQRIESYTGVLIIKCLSPECLKIGRLYHFKTFG